MVARRTGQFKRSMVRRWLLSYLAASLIPVILAVLLGIYCTRIVAISARDGSAVMLQALSRSFDSALRDVETISQGLLLDDRFLPYNSGSTEPTSLEYYQATAALRSVIPQGPASGVMVFNPKLGRYIGQEQWGNFNDLYLRNEYNLGLSQGDIGSMFGAEVPGIRLFNADIQYSGGDSIKRVLVIKPLNYARGGKLHDWYVACLFTLGDLFMTLSSDERDLVILQGDRVLYSFAQSYPAGSLHPELLTHKRLGGDLVGTRSSETGPYTYAMLTDRKVIFHAMVGYFWMVALLLGGSVVLGTSMLLSRLRRDWSSYEAAIKASGTEIDQDADAKDEYLPFVSSMQGLQQQKEGMRDVIRQQTETLKQHTLSELVEHGEPVAARTLAECGIFLKGDNFVIALFILGEQGEPKAFGELLSFALSAEAVQLLPFDSSHGLAYILNSEKPLEDTAVRKIEQVAERMGCRYAAASSSVVGLDKLGQAYLEAINVLEYERGRNINEFLTYSDVRQMTSQINFTYTTEAELALEKSIRDGAAMESVALVDKVFAENQESGASPKCLRYLLFALASTAYRTASKLDGRYTDALPELTLPPIIQGDSLERSHREVDQMVQKLCEAVAKVNSQCADSSSKSYAIYQRAMEEVQEHYSEQNLNVSQLADTLGVSIVYLSRTFKKYHTTNISDYITRYRLFMSKKLLCEGLKVGEVAQQCGFGSLRTYLRVFKQVERVTPGQWRDGSSAKMEEQA